MPEMNTLKYTSGILLILLVAFVSDTWAQGDKSQGYILEIEKEIAQAQPGPHSGGGNTIGYSFFDKAENLNYVFRKRVLEPGSSIGYHLQEKDEVYYILSGKGK